MLHRRLRAQACCSAGCGPGLAAAQAPVVCGAGARPEIGGVGPAGTGRGDVPADVPGGVGGDGVVGGDWKRARVGWGRGQGREGITSGYHFGISFRIFMDKTGYNEIFTWDKNMDI